MSNHITITKLDFCAFLYSTYNQQRGTLAKKGHLSDDDTCKTFGLWLPLNYLLWVLSDKVEKSTPNVDWSKSGNETVFAVVVLTFTTFTLIYGEWRRLVSPTGVSTRSIIAKTKKWKKCWLSYWKFNIWYNKERKFFIITHDKLFLECKSMVMINVDNFDQNYG